MFLQRSSNTVYAGYSPLPMEPPPVASATVHSAIKATVAGVRDGVRDGAVKPTRISLLPRLPRMGWGVVCGRGVHVGVVDSLRG